MSNYNILIEKEYYQLSKNDKTPIIACLMMVKNEERRIHVSLDSVVGCVKCYIIYDTGSTDKTTEIIIKHCEKHKINLYMIQGIFTNFSESRNISLDYADTKEVHYLVLLDTNDQLQGGDKLLKFAKMEMGTDKKAYLINQHWWSGVDTKYFNIRFLKIKNNWRYNGCVHEWMEDKSKIDKSKNDEQPLKMPDDIILYQDRTKDDDKTGKRFVTDKVLLLSEYKKDPTQTRTLYYLAQTCDCLNQLEDSFYYYKLRYELNGFEEEKFHSLLKCGYLSEKLNHSWHDSMSYYMKAIEHSPRAEPMVRIAEYYNKIGHWLLSYTFAKMACSLSYPTNALLFVDGKIYKYTRWHILGIVSYFCNKYEDGRIGCKIAIEAGLNIEMDTKNLEFYTKKEDESPINKKQFISKEVKNLRLSQPNIPIIKLEKLALSKWKNR